MVKQPECKSRVPGSFYPLTYMVVLYAIYPDQYTGALVDGRASIKEHLSGDAINLITPKTSFHIPACTEMFAEEIMATISDVVKRENGLSKFDQLLEGQQGRDTQMGNQE